MNLQARGPARSGYRGTAPAPDLNSLLPHYTDPSINRWLAERGEVIAGLLQAVKMVEQPAEVFDPVCGALITTLVDYVSAGHFEFYEKFLDEVADEPGVSHLPEEIRKTTEAVLVFQDYAAAMAEVDTRREALAHLGLILEDRFELEDVMVRLYDAHKMRELTTA